MTDLGSDEDIVNTIMAQLRIIVAGQAPEYVCSALGCLLVEAAINAASGEVDIAQDIVSDVFDGAQESLAHFASLRGGRAN